MCKVAAVPSRKSTVHLKQYETPMGDIGVKSENKLARACRFEKDLWKLPVVPSPVTTHSPVEAIATRWVSIVNFLPFSWGLHALTLSNVSQLV